MNKTVKRNILITAVLAATLVVVGLLLFINRREAKGLSEVEARTVAERYLPESAVFVTGSELGNEYELHYFDTAAGHSYRIKLSQADRDVNSIYAHAVTAEQGSSIEIERATILDILEKQFNGAILEEMSFVAGETPPTGSIQLLFSWENFSGSMDLNPENGDILSFNLKTAAQVVIPVDGSENRRFLSDIEARERAQVLLEDAVIHDIELEMIDELFVYEVYASDDEYNYVLNLDAETGEQINRKTTRNDWLQAPAESGGDSTSSSNPDREPSTSTEGDDTTVDSQAGSSEERPSSNGGTEPTEAPSTTVTETTTTASSASPTTTAPTTAPSTAAPTTASTTKVPTSAPSTAAPTTAPTSAPTTAAPTTAPTVQAGGREWAIQIALTRVSGATSSHVKDADYDDDDHEWEIEIEYNGYEYEIIINAHNGQIVDIEIDDIDD